MIRGYSGLEAEKTLDSFREEAIKDLSSAVNDREIQDVSTKYLGRKGIITGYLRNISSLPVEERPVAGKNANILKKDLENRINEAILKLEADKENKELLLKEKIDVSLPGKPVNVGKLHPITQTMRTICDIFTKMGFNIAKGPEIEEDYFNFQALNFPKDHPARDMQDTFFVSEDVVLRTHTSPMQVRVMEKTNPPLRTIAPGKVYRCDSDLTHTPMFHQVEGLMVGENISLGDLKGVLTAFIHSMFDDRTSLRFRPSFFPFTEPSAEVDILCVGCRGKGCRICSHTGWLEILGSGMVHPNVFKSVGYDTNVYTGFAFGMGVERIAMLKYQIDDIRKNFENDLRFLGQF
jgi:phenylalanyl-tRNA synthetase alpha chain